MVDFPKVMEFSLQIYIFTAFLSCIKVRLSEHIWQACHIIISQSLCAHLILFAPPQVYSEVVQSAKHPGSHDCLWMLLPHTGLGLARLD